MRALIVIALSAGLWVAAPVGAMAKATVCKDPAGKVITCPAKPAETTAKAATPKVVAAEPAPTKAAHAASAASCKDANGKFIACPAKPVVAVAPAKPVAPAKQAAHPASSSAVPTISRAGAPAGATAKCKDGSYSMSKTHSGSCSHQGGVAAWL